MRLPFDAHGTLQAPQPRFEPPHLLSPTKESEVPWHRLRPGDAAAQTLSHHIRDTGNFKASRFGPSLQTSRHHIRDTSNFKASRSEPPHLLSPTEAGHATDSLQECAEEGHDIHLSEAARSKDSSLGHFRKMSGQQVARRMPAQMRPVSVSHTH